MADIVIPEHMHPDAVASLEKDFDVLFDAELWKRPDELLDALKDARAILVRNMVEVRGGLLETASNLKVVGRLGVGLDNIDLDDCAARGIEVFPASGANRDSVAELVLGAILCLFRPVYHATDRVLAGTWPRLDLAGREVKGHHLGIIGFGFIGKALAERARAMGMSVSAYDPYVGSDDPAWAALSVERVSLDDVLTQSDVVSLHAPLTDETRDLIDAAAIEKMKEGAVLINAARGGMADEAAVAKALKSGKLSGAYFDVFDTEPLAAGSVFEGVPNLILTPHIGALTEEANIRVSQLTADNVRRVLERE